MWFEVDKAGLQMLLERRGKEFAIFELVQNAWDEKTTRVDVSLERVPGTRKARLIVEDDNPTGFTNLAHAFTLFAESEKKGNAERRGRFNLGEKLVLALCDSAEIVSTTGGYAFDHHGRRTLRRRREVGSTFNGVLTMTQEDIANCQTAVQALIPPAGIVTTYNGTAIPSRRPVAEVESTLPTEIADETGALRSTRRKTRIRIYEPREDEVPMIYEMGIPVCETGDRWHVDVQQKVPLNLDRDNVPASYLNLVRALVLDEMAAKIDVDDANSGWVREAVQKHGDDLTAATIGRVMDLRFSERRVAYDPSDPEANSLAVAKGYVVVHGSELSKSEWQAARRTGSILPAGRVTPSPKPFSPDGEPLKFLSEKDWTPAIAWVVGYAKSVALRTISCAIEVRIASDVTWPFAGAYGRGSLILNLGRLGHKWFEGDLIDINTLLIHELGHHFCGNHLASEYHDALCKLGAKLATIALAEPELFDRT